MLLLLKADDPQVRVVCQTGTVQMTKAMLSVKTGCCEEQSSHEGWLSVEELACPKILCNPGNAAAVVRTYGWRQAAG